MSGVSKKYRKLSGDEKESAGFLLAVSAVCSRNRVMENYSALLNLFIIVHTLRHTQDGACFRVKHSQQQWSIELECGQGGLLSLCPRVADTCWTPLSPFCFLHSLSELVD